MDQSLFHAILLGIIEGLTEFIPVSSTGHLILLIDLLGFAGPPGKVFEIIIQLGAILAVCMVYQKRVFGILRHPTDPVQQRFVLNLIIAFIPAAVLGATLHGFIKSVLFDPIVVSVSLIVGGFLILLIERIKPAPTTESVDALTWRKALAIGFCQTIAMIPGTSRSGATIMGALMLGVERKVATEFSFFLAIPTMLGAATYDTYKNWSQLSGEGWELIAVGFIAAFLAALLVVRSVVAFISKHGFAPFAYYRILIGSVMLVLLLA